jgi:hypothetical protein
MTEFSIQDAAFTGFRIVREHPKALVAWAAYALALSVVFTAILIGAMGRDLAILSAGGAPGAQPSPEMLAALGRLVPGYLLLIVAGMVSNSVLGAAMIRAVLRPAEDRFGFFRLGGDELRQLGLVALTFLVFMGLYIGCLILAVVAGAVVGIAARPATGVVVVVLAIGLIGLMIVLAVRLSLAPAQTFETGRINLFGSWGLTRGRFWPLFATYLLALALIVVVAVLSQLLILAISALVAGGNPFASPTVSGPALTSLTAYFGPAQIVRTVMGAGVSALIWPVAFTPPTAIYRRLAPSAGFAADVFA